MSHPVFLIDQTVSFLGTKPRPRAIKHSFGLSVEGVTMATYDHVMSETVSMPEDEILIPVFLDGLADYFSVDSLPCAITNVNANNFNFDVEAAKAWLNENITPEEAEEHDLPITLSRMNFIAQGY